jgi:putative CocE/NonD family hydrolase
MSVSRSLVVALVATSVSTVSAAHAQPRAQNAAAAEAVKAKYEKREIRIPMRDGVKLFTSVYIPRDTSRSYPILMSRTPYGVGPYGPDAYRTSLGMGERYMNEGMIFVYQDARGRNYSEGVFTEMTPHKDVKKGPKDVDESTDSYDTVDWLVKTLPHNNGRVGIVGVSYPGFYTTASCIDAHPAVKACSPQAPMTNIGIADDVFHNGAFLLPHNWTFYASFGRGPRNEPGPDARYPFSMGTPDAYKYYLELGPLGPASQKVYAPAGTAPAWDSVLAHPNYDQYWQKRDIRPHIRKMAPAVLVVGGFYDTEDLFGPWAVYDAAQRQSPNSDTKIVIGPWSHGGWGRGDGTSLGSLRWNSKTGPFFRDSVEFPFFMHALKDAPGPDLPEALVFRTGADTWDRYDAWPPSNVEKKSLYLGDGGTLSFNPPTKSATTARDPGFTSYVSDPNKPVPLVDRIESQGMPRDYITADQRFASRRPDVVVFQTAPLTEDLTIAGPVNPVLYVATSGTDADFIVKLVDVFPDNAPDWPGDSSGFKVGGYQQLVRGEPFRGKFRKSFASPVPFVPNVPDSIRFSMPDINHTFRKGHRVMVQVQSTWFPHIDRNPQKFVPNIFFAKPSDFQTATMRVYHSPGKLTRLEVGVVPTPKM